eukprot:TRINITY_DN2267_c2_g1_i2.p1 TRINITY_DN2267_c2_g1~~TRINITY_DN2267_c2_g1_i2.p1  ORF type:complete len:314 (+),score=105.52 TRINITY_DN2267_c2_g1_i2:162-1103(+)
MDDLPSVSLSVPLPPGESGSEGAEQLPSLSGVTLDLSPPPPLDDDGYGDSDNASEPSSYPPLDDDITIPPLDAAHEEEEFNGDEERQERGFNTDFSLHTQSDEDEDASSLPSVTIDVSTPPPLDDSTSTGLITNERVSNAKRKKKKKKRDIGRAMFPAAENVVPIARRRNCGGCTEGSFSSELPGDLEGYVGEQEFSEAITELNSILASSLDIWVPYVPCVMCVFPASLLILIEGLVNHRPFWLSFTLFITWLVLTLTSVVLFVVYFLHQSKLERAITQMDARFRDRGIRFTQGKRRELATLFAVIEKSSSAV